MATKDYESTVMRMVGNIMPELLRQLHAVPTHERHDDALDSVVVEGVRLARAIVAEVQRTAEAKS